MQQTNASVRVQKLDEAKEIIAELEEQKGLELSGPRGALFRAGDTVDSVQAYTGHMEKAMGQTAGLAIEGGYDGSRRKLLSSSKIYKRASQTTTKRSATPFLFAWMSYW